MFVIPLSLQKFTGLLFPFPSWIRISKAFTLKRVASRASIAMSLLPAALNVPVTHLNGKHPTPRSNHSTPPTHTPTPGYAIWDLGLHFQTLKLTVSGWA